MGELTPRSGDRPERRTGIEPVTLLAGLLTLGIAAYVLTGGGVLELSGLRWLVAGGAVLSGLLMVGASLRPRNRR